MPKMFMRFILITMPTIALMKKSQNIREKNLNYGEKKKDTQWDLVIKVWLKPMKVKM